MSAITTNLKASVGVAPAKRGRGRPSSRDVMLDAAQHIALKQGAMNLTLDAVAKKAGVSKGGLMYNFPTKQALLIAMIERVVEHNHKAYLAEIARLPDTPGRNLRAYVGNSTRAPDTDDQLSGSLLAALTSDPALRAPAVEYFTQRFKLLSRDVAFEHAAIVHLATEGLWMMELLQMSPFSASQRMRIVRTLLKMTEEESLP